MARCSAADDRWTYLCFEGVEKLLHKWLHPVDHSKDHPVEGKVVQAINASNDELDEKQKIRGAIRTDFILSAEIIVIALGTMESQSIGMQAIVLSTIAVLMTAGVYGLVAAILKIDDLGIWMQMREGTTSGIKFQQKLGRMLVAIAPYLMRFLAVAGTAAMFLVGGGIVVHGIPPLHHWMEHAFEPLHHVALVGGFAYWFAEALFNLVIGVGAGLILVLLLNSGRKLLSRKHAK